MNETPSGDRHYRISELGKEERQGMFLRVHRFGDIVLDIYVCSQTLFNKRECPITN